MFKDIIRQEELKSYDKQDDNRVVINEEARKARFRLLGPLSQCHNIVVHTRSLARRTKEFRKNAERMILIDNRTRWNSWFKMLDVLLNLRPVVKKYYTDHEDELIGDILSY